MYCEKCGTLRTDNELYCEKCGNKYNDNKAVPHQSSDNFQENKEIANESCLKGVQPLKVVQYKSDGRSVSFYEDKLTYDGNCIFYKDIAIVEYESTSGSMFGLIVWYATTSMYFKITLYDGTKRKINASGFSLYSIGTTRTSKKLWHPLFATFGQIVVTNIAENILSKIKNGATINIAGLEVNSEFATYKQLLKKEPIRIDKSNFNGCGRGAHNYKYGYPIIVNGKDGKKLFSVSEKDSNALLLPLVLNELYTG